MKNVLFFLLIFSANIVFAQKNVSGIITDKSGNPVKDVKVSVKYANVETFTSSDGKYSVEVPEGKKILEFSKHSFRTQEVEISGETMNITLIAISDVKDIYDLSLEELMQLEIITASKTEEKIAAIPASVVILTQKDIELYGFESLTEIVEHVLGYYNIDDYTHAHGNFGVRGFFIEREENTNIITLVNNIPQLVNHLNIPVQSIDRIEIIRGPMSVIYGSGSTFGAINIITNQSQKNSASFSYGSLNTYKAFTKITGKKTNDFSYSFNAGFKQTEGFDVLYKDLIYEKRFKDFQNMEKFAFNVEIPDNFSTKKHFERQSLYLDFFGNFKNVYFAARHFNETFERFFIYPSFDKGQEYSDAISNFALGWKKNVSSKFTFNVEASYNRRNLDIKYDVLHRGFYGIWKTTQNNLNFELNGTFSPSPELNIIAGINLNNFFKVASIADVPSAGDTSLTNYYYEYKPGDINSLGATFAQATYSVGNIKFIGGFRLEEDNSFTEYRYYHYNASLKPLLPTRTETVFNSKAAVFLPRLAVVYMENNHIFKILYGVASKRYTVVDILPEKVSTFELNYTHFSKNITAGIGIFYNTFEDLVISEYGFNQETNKYIEKKSNSGKMQTLGCELTFLYEFSKNLRLETGISYQKTTDNNQKDIEVGYSPHFLGQVKMFYKVNQYLSFALTSYFVDEMETSWIPKNPNDTTSVAHRLGDKIDSYFLLGSNIRVENFYKGLYFSLHGSNLLNVQYRYPTTSQDEMLGKGSIGRKRFILATFGFKF